MTTRQNDGQREALRALLGLRRAVWDAGISADSTGTAPGGKAYKYNSLPALIQKTWPLCHDHGFVVGWEFGKDSDGPDGVMLCNLIHVETGHKFSHGVPWCAQPVPVLLSRDDATHLVMTPGWAQSLRQKGSPIQSLGASLTFVRRYSLEMALGIAVEKDGDGAAATESPSPPRITEDQVKVLRAAAQRLPNEVARARTAQVQQQHGCHLHHLPPQAFGQVLAVFEAPVTAVAVPTAAPLPSADVGMAEEVASIDADPPAVSTSPPTFDPSTAPPPGSPPGSLTVAQLETLRNEVQKLPAGGVEIQRILALGAELSPTGAMDALPSRHVAQVLQAIRSEQELVVKATADNDEIPF